MFWTVRKKIYRIAGVAAALLTLPGCQVNDVSAADEEQAVYFSPLQSREVSPRVIEDPGAPNDGGVDEIKHIVTELAQNLERAAAEGDQTALDMAQLEAQFIERGRYLDLVGIYQNMLADKTNSPVDTNEFSEALNQRLVSAYIDLGQQRLARAALDEMIQEKPDDPTTWLLNASFWAPAAPTNADAAARVAANWQKALDIDPEFVLPDGSQRPLGAQLDELRRFVPEEKIAAAVHELHEQMNAEALNKNIAAGSPAKAENTAPGTPSEVAQNTAPGTPNSPENTAPGTPSEVAQNTAPGTPSEVAQNTAPGTPSEAVQNTAPGTPQVPENKDKSAASGEDLKKMRVPFLLAHGNMALAQEEGVKAERYFKEVLSREPDHFEARFGLIRAGWVDEGRRNALVAELHELAERSDLRPRQQMDLGKFVYFELKDNQLALKLWGEAKKQDPTIGDSTGLNALIEDASRPKED